MNYITKSWKHSTISIWLVFAISQPVNAEEVPFEPPFHEMARIDGRIASLIDHALPEFVGQKLGNVADFNILIEKDKSWIYVRFSNKSLPFSEKPNGRLPRFTFTVKLAMESYEVMESYYQR